jgi:hypothetical protein
MAESLRRAQINLRAGMSVVLFEKWRRTWLELYLSFKMRLDFAVSHEVNQAISSANVDRHEAGGEVPLALTLWLLFPSFREIFCHFSIL